MAAGERSVWRTDRESGKSSGHIKAHCHRESSTHATGKTYCRQTGKRMFLRITNNSCMTYCCVVILIFHVCFFNQEDRGKIRDLFSSHLRWTTILLWFIWWVSVTSSSITHWLSFLILKNFLLMHRHTDQLSLCLLRFANAFSYYGLVLLTTELFQEGGACGSESLLQQTSTEALTHSRAPTTFYLGSHIKERL